MEAIFGEILNEPFAGRNMFFVERFKVVDPWSKNSISLFCVGKIIEDEMGAQLYGLESWICEKNEFRVVSG